MKSKIKFKTLLVIVIFLYVGYIFAHQQVTMNSMKKELTAKQNKYNQLVEKNLNLKDEIELSKTDAYMEKLARERLGLVKKGEIPVVNNGNNK
ncbi:MAG: septum formation initiator family protein [Bacillota bacterium]|nr:septum formation initiator family protein [Bacillota bacterium]